MIKGGFFLVANYEFILHCIINKISGFSSETFSLDQGNSTLVGVALQKTKLRPPRLLSSSQNPIWRERKEKLIIREERRGEERETSGKKTACGNGVPACM